MKLFIVFIITCACCVIVCHSNQAKPASVVVEKKEVTPGPGEDLPLFKNVLDTKMMFW